MKTSTFKSDNQKTLEAILNKDLKFIKENAKVAYSRNSYDYKNDDIEENLIGQTFLELVRDNANDFTKDIAIKALEQKRELSDKQAWCIAYQIINNLQVYTLAIENYNEVCLSEVAKEEENNEDIIFEVKVRVSTEKNTDLFNVESFTNLKDAQNNFSERIAVAMSEFNDGEFSEYFEEALVIDKVTENDIEEIQSETIYYEGKKDKNNYKGNYPSWYWFKAERKENELVYNFFYDGKLEYENIKESELNKWYNY